MVDEAVLKTELKTRVNDLIGAKQKVGEELVKFMLTEKGWNVTHFGYERSFPDIAENINFSTKMMEPLNRIRSTPDFFVLHGKTEKQNVAYFIEVKYRTVDKNGEFEIDNVKCYQDFWPGTILVIVKKDFPYLIFQEVGKLQVKPKYSVKEFSDRGTSHTIKIGESADSSPCYESSGIFHLTPTNISMLLAKFSKLPLSQAILERLNEFERTPEGYFYAYNEKTYYSYITETGKECVKQWDGTPIRTGRLLS